MKRSEINAAIRAAESTLAAHRWLLPDWASWALDDHGREPALAAHLRERQLGWDVTDFGLGEFARQGLTLFCVRNGKQGDPSSLPYAEKLLFVGEGQVTPFHAHKVKIEDIIVRGGGNLMVAFSEDGSFAQGTVVVDGRAVADPYAQPLRLRPGQSVTIPRGVQHSFWGEEGQGDVFVAEVSQANDDLTDNYFRDGIGRFAEVDEDEPPHRLLWSDRG